MVTLKRFETRLFADDLLVYGNRKIESIIWDIRTEDKRDAAIRALFTLLDDEWQVYGELDPDDIPWDGTETDQHQ